jgi:chromosomal replication initiation ATPase DnaA
VSNPWDDVLERLREAVGEEDFRRWFSATAYASDSGSQINVWVPSEGIRRLLETQYYDEIRRALAALDRSDTGVRFVVAGFGEDDEDSSTID